MSESAVGHWIRFRYTGTCRDCGQSTDVQGYRLKGVAAANGLIQCSRCFEIQALRDRARALGAQAAEKRAACLRCGQDCRGCEWAGMATRFEDLACFLERKAEAMAQGLPLPCPICKASRQDEGPCPECGWPYNSLPF